MPDPCDPIRLEIATIEGDIDALQEDLRDASPPQKAGIIREIRALQTKLSERRAKLVECVGVPPPPPRVDPSTVPVAVSLVRIHCIEQEDGEPPIFDTEDDEPYVIVLSVYGQGRFLGVPPVGVQLVQSGLFRIGPIEDFDKGDVKPPPANTLWGLANAPAVVPLINQLVFFVALLENDSADPAQVENRMVAFSQAGLTGLLLAAEGRTDLDPNARFELFVDTARRGFEGAISLARQAIDPDDMIGPAQVLRFNDAEHQALIRGAVPVIERTLRFTGDDADYELTFGLKR
jgi:hypothetical protein